MSGPRIGRRADPGAKAADGERAEPEAPNRDGPSSRDLGSERGRDPCPRLAKRPPGRLPRR
ncbi:MAG TPA: hypothetical protein VLT81_14780 [Chondromyces sp.]|nr:hypothetical protein [Chondromyces sp.]